MKISKYKQGLGIEGVKLFDDWRKKYGLSEDNQLFLLSLIAGCWETILNSRAIIAIEGSTISHLHGKKAHPEIAIIKDARAQAMAGLKQLDLKETVAMSEVLRDFM